MITIITEGRRLSAGDGGMTLISTLVSTRKRVPVGPSVTQKRRLVIAVPGGLVAVSVWRRSFPTVIEVVLLIAGWLVEGACKVTNNDER